MQMLNKALLELNEVVDLNAAINEHGELDLRQVIKLLNDSDCSKKVEIAMECERLKQHCL